MAVHHLNYLLKVSLIEFQRSVLLVILHIAIHDMFFSPSEKSPVVVGVLFINLFYKVEVCSVN